MGIGFRVFLIGINDSLTKIPMTHYSRLKERDTTLRFPQYKNQQLRYVLVCLDFDNREPISIDYIGCGFLKFDFEGRIDTEYLNNETKSGMEMLDYDLDDKSSNLINAQHIFAKKVYHDNYTWKLTSELEKKIYDHIFK